MIDSLDLTPQSLRDNFPLNTRVIIPMNPLYEEGIIVGYVGQYLSIDFKTSLHYGHENLWLLPEEIDRLDTD